MIRDVQTSGAMPALEALVRFAGQRQKLIANNIANFDTPDYRPMDVSAAGFQAQLGAAVRRRRESTGGTHGELRLERTREVEQGAGGLLRLSARTASGNVLFHDRNNRDLERTMQDLVENAGAYRVATEFLRKGFEQMRGAIAERA